MTKIVRIPERCTSSKNTVSLVATMVFVVLGVAACSSGKAATGTTSTSTRPSTTGTPSTTVPATAPTTSSSAPLTTSPAPRATAPTAPSRPIPHVMLVMMENKDFSEVIGQSDQPYTNGLARDYGLATASYGFGHPSLPNYLDIVSGSNQGVTDDNPPSSHSFPNTPTLADQLVGAGFSVKAYAENLPSPPDANAGEYAVRHVPWEYFPRTKVTVANSSSLIGDLNGSTAPDFVWYTPNLIDDEHDGTVQQGDAFLSRLIPAVQATSWYRSGGQIVVEWDEADTENSGIAGGGGGHIPTIVISSALKAHPQSEATPVDTAGILRSIEDAYGLAHLGASSDPANGNIDTLLS